MTSSNDDDERVGGDDNVDDDDMIDQKAVTCTFAVTGPNPAFQSIFVCQTCHGGSEEEEEDEDDDANSARRPLPTSCICAGCADVCHIEHEVIYIGMGPAYCDCQNLLNTACACSCQLEQVSRQKAETLGITSPGSSMLTRDLPRKQPATSDDEEEYVMHVFRIPVLEQQQTLRKRLVLQAQELVQHSRETFWVDATSSNASFSEWCDLEQLAWKIFRRHVQYYQLEDNDDHRIGGAEWWVQVKKSSTASATTAVGIVEEQEEQKNKLSEEAIDLHYDKDEALAESFGLGSFPTLSTVTYLSGNDTHRHGTAGMAPTVVVPHRYDQPEAECMNYLLVSHPRVGKHVVFDGRLLHGAPAHVALRKASASTEDASFLRNGDDNDTDEGIRLTFLVNIWLTGRPAGVQRLPEEIRAALRQDDHHDDDDEVLDTITEQDALLEFANDEPVERIHLNPKMADDMNRIELPFVSKGATWIGDDDDEDDGIRLITFPPPPPSHQADTVLVHFGPGVQAYLERTGEDFGGDDEYDDDDDEGEGNEVKPKGTYQEFYV